MRKDWGNNTLVGWRLWYADGSSIDSTQMKFDQAPQVGVAALIKYYKRANGGYSHEVQNGLDLYILFSDKAEDLVLPPQIKKGKNMPNGEWDKLLASIRKFERDAGNAVTQMEDSHDG